MARAAHEKEGAEAVAAKTTMEKEAAEARAAKERAVAEAAEAKAAKERAVAEAAEAKAAEDAHDRAKVRKRRRAHSSSVRRAPRATVGTLSLPRAACVCGA